MNLRLKGSRKIVADLPSRVENDQVIAALSFVGLELGLRQMEAVLASWLGDHDWVADQCWALVESLKL